MVRTRHYGGDSSPHDSTGPRNKGDISRPLGAPPPEGGGGGKKSGGWGCDFLVLAILAGLGSVGYGVAHLVRAVTG